MNTDYLIFSPIYISLFLLYSCSLLFLFPHYILHIHAFLLSFIHNLPGNFFLFSFSKYMSLSLLFIIPKLLSTYHLNYLLSVAQFHPSASTPLLSFYSSPQSLLLSSASTHFLHFYSSPPLLLLSSTSTPLLHFYSSHPLQLLSSASIPLHSF